MLLNTRLKSWKSGWKRDRRRQRSVRPGIKPLESRSLLSAISWTNRGDARLKDTYRMAVSMLTTGVGLGASAGRYREAAEMRRPNLATQDDKGLPCDLYFLAMSHHRLGETERAQDYLAWAVRWTNVQRGLAPPHLEELAPFRAEATELLSLPAEAKKEEPKKEQSPTGP